MRTKLTSPSFAPARRREGLVLAALCGGLALAALSACLALGWQGTLGQDGGAYLYAGRKLLEGVPPYVSMFTQKGPLAIFLAGAGVALGRLVGVSDLFAARMFFMLCGCLFPPALLLLTLGIGGSRRQGILTALTGLAFYPYWMKATAGPQSKVPMLPLQIAALWCMSTRRWLWAGLLGGLAGLIWQPMLAFPLVALVLAWLQEERRWRAAGRVLFGMALPLAATVAYFAAKHALYELVDRTILIHLGYREFSATSSQQQIWQPLQTLSADYASTLFVVLLGLGVLIWMCARRVQAHGGVWPALRSDPLAALAATLPAPLLWSSIDFQGGPDLYVFLPYAALGFGMLLELALRGVEPAGWRWAGFGLACLALVGGSMLQNWTSRNAGLTEQLSAAQTIKERFGPDLKMLTFGQGDALALLAKNYPTPYLNCFQGTGRHLNAHEPGGFSGWLQRLQAYDADIVVTGGTLCGEYRPQIISWLKSDFRKETIGPWTVYVSTRYPPAKAG